MSQAADQVPTPRAPTIEVTKASKWYGTVVAVSDVSLKIFPGVTGLLGPNGAGKTTLLHMITGLISPSEGDIRVLGQHVRDNPGLHRRIGVMAEHEAVYGFLTGREYVTLAARLNALPNVEEAVDRAIAAVDLTGAQHRKLGAYSRGMRQRMRLAATLVHDPDVLVLDEPLNGTDPRQRLEYHDLMRRMAAEGRTIVVSSHILEEVETLADRILLMVSGKLAASGDFRAIREKLDERPYQVRVVASRPREIASALVGLEAVDSVNVGEDGEVLVMSRHVAVLQRSVARLARERGIRLMRVEPLDDTLESVFSYVVER